MSNCIQLQSIDRFINEIPIYGIFKWTNTNKDKNICVDVKDIAFLKSSDKIFSENKRCTIIKFKEGSYTYQQSSYYEVDHTIDECYNIIMDAYKEKIKLINQILIPLNGEI